MRPFLSCFVLFIIIAIGGCNQSKNPNHTLSHIETAWQNGQLSFATQWADSLLKTGKPDSLTQIKLKSLVDRSDRIKADFSLTEAETEVRLNKAFGEYSQNDRVTWEKNNWLEYKVIDGEKHYFNRAVSNLKLILTSQHSKPMGSSDLITDKFSRFKLDHSRKVIHSPDSNGKSVLPVKMKITYKLTVKADAVPDAKIVRCWMPWPRESHDRQGDVKLLKTIPENHFISPDSAEQRSIYFEKQASKGKPVEFEIQFEYKSAAQYFDLSKLKPLSYDTASSVYKKNTAEQYPQIIFTNTIKKLSDSIVNGITNPVEKVKKLYYWINDHIIWTGALEYSIIPDIPGYVLKNHRGDCGMQTLLLMTMARYQKIPVKWQSGWMLHPVEVNLHDWAEIFLDGYGWVPADQSFGIQQSADPRMKYFYLGGIDAYRLIVNDDFSRDLFPAKVFPRSETVDFQRGEVEWRGGNLYFDKWSYNMKVDYRDHAEK
jgi:hypothetical protein